MRLYDEICHNAGISGRQPPIKERGDECSSPTSLTLEPRGRQGNPQMEFPSMFPLLSSLFLHYFLPSPLFYKSHILQY
jgi:hypothetical protein